MDFEQKATEVATQTVMGYVAENWKLGLAAFTAGVGVTLGAQYVKRAWLDPMMAKKAEEAAKEEAKKAA